VFDDLIPQETQLSSSAWQGQGLFDDLIPNRQDGAGGPANSSAANAGATQPSTATASVDSSDPDAAAVSNPAATLPGTGEDAAMQPDPSGTTNPASTAPAQPDGSPAPVAGQTGDGPGYPPTWWSSNNVSALAPSGDPLTDARSQDFFSKLVPEKKQMHYIKELPTDAVQLVAGDGQAFAAPQHADFQAVFAAGQQAGLLNLTDAYNKIVQFGKFDFQREDHGADFYFYKKYTDASNYAVGMYMRGAGYPRAVMIALGRYYMHEHPRKDESTDPVGWWNRGYDDAGYFESMSGANEYDPFWRQD
jgi:hypothetical protein